MAVSPEILASQWQTVFPWLPKLPDSKNDFIVFTNNVVNDVASYERTWDNEITFNEALNENDKIRVLVPFEQPTSCSSNIIYPDAPTLTGLYTKVRREMRIDRNGRIWSNEDIKEALNNAILQVQKSTNFWWQENDACQEIQTVQWEQEYSIATNTQWIKLAEYENRYLLSAQKETLLAIGETIPTWTPRYYYIWGGNIGLWPIPSTSNKEIKIHYQKFLIPLDQDTDTLPFPFDFTKTVVLYTAYDLFSQTSDSKNIQRANVKKQRYQEELNTLRLAYLVPDSNQMRYKTSYVSSSRKWMTRRGRAGRLID